MLAHAAALLLAATAGADAEVTAPALEPAFSFGSYGRLQLGYDMADRPGRTVNVVGHGPRLVEPSYQELNFYYRVIDPRGSVGTDAHLVAALGVGEDMFNYTGTFGATIAIRNFYMDVRNVLVKDLTVWFGERMYRGDDLYLLDFWPLDNLNTLGGGIGYNIKGLQLDLHFGVNRLDNAYQLQIATAPSTDGQGVLDYILERQRTIVSLRGTYSVGPVRLRAYGELHELPAGQQVNHVTGETKALPSDWGGVFGAQASGGTQGFSGMLVAKVGTGLGAFGDLTVPYGFSLDRKVAGASLGLVAAGVSYEHPRFAIPVCTYFATFRDATGLDVNARNYEEFVLDTRPTVFVTDMFHIALDLSYQVRAPHTLTPDGSRPLSQNVWQIGIMPMLVPGGSGMWSRPAIRLIYAIRFVSQDARNDLFAIDDQRRSRPVSQFIGAGVEWWFNSSYR